MTSSRARAWLWPLSAIAAAIIPVAGVFTLSRIFYVRDLTLAFRSRFLFLRHSVYSGVFPLWDAYSGNGQSAASDALYQLFHFPSLPIRLLLPEVVAYNMWIALPVPLAAGGAYLYLTRYVAAPAAAIGAMAFALAGPTVSTVNFPNLSWSVACVPFVFWAIDRLAVSRRAGDAVLLAVVLAAQALAGEPVTFAATLAISGLYVLGPLRGWREPRLLGIAAAAVLLGGLLAAVQFVPLAAAGRDSIRAIMVPDDFWSFHPLAILELVVPHFFGDYFTSNLSELTWMTALNSGREPFYYTMYLGVPVIIAAAAAAFSGRPRTTFWALVVVGCALASMGAHTPFYPALQWSIPGLKEFRFPVKYLSLAGMGLSVLAATACDWMIREDVPARATRLALIVALTLACLAYGFIAWQMIAPREPLQLIFDLARTVQAQSPVQGAEFLIYRARPLVTTLFLKVLCASFLFAVACSRHRERRLALVAFWLLAAVDLLAANSSVNPTMPIARLGTPAWVSKLPADMHERVYIGGRLGGFVATRDVDAPKYIADIPGFTAMEQRFIIVNELLFHTAGTRIRESLSYDLPLLWPVLNSKTINRFRVAPRADRMRFLERVGTRYAILPPPAPEGAKALATLVGAPQLTLYDVYPDAKRIYVVPDALIGKSPDWAVEGLFQARFDPGSGILVSSPPPPASGFPGPPSKPFAEFAEDGLNRVVVRAGLPADGYLALLDSYDPAWHVEVDGAPAPLMRANGLFRAVHLRRGTHLVTFMYRPLPLYVGASLTAAAAAVLIAWWAIDVRRRSRTAA
jgi:hypothetical protein